MNTPDDPRAADLSDVRSVLDAAAWRLRGRFLVRALAIGAWVGLGLALAVAVASRLWWPLPVSAAIVAPLPFAIAMVAAAIAGLVRPGYAAREAAILVDRKLGTDELLVTALHLSDGPDTPAKRALLADLERQVERLGVGDALPVRVPRHVRFQPVLIALVIGVLLIPPRAGAIATREPETPVGREAVELQQRMDALAQEFEVELPPEVVENVDDLIDDLGNEDITPEEAIRRMDEIREQLAGVEAELQGSQDTLDALDAAAKELKDAEGTQDLADALAKGDLDGAAEATDTLGEHVEGASDAEKQEVGEALKRAGERLKDAEDLGAQGIGDAMFDAGDRLSQQGKGSSAGQQGSQGRQGGDPGSPGQQGSDAGQQGSQGRGTKSATQGLADELRRHQDLAKKLKEDQQKLEQSQRANGAMQASQQRLGKPNEDGQSSQCKGGSCKMPGHGHPTDGSGQGQGASEGTGLPSTGDGQSDGAAEAGAGHTWEQQSSGLGSAGSGQHNDADRNSDRQGGKEIDDFQELYAPVRLDGAESVLAGVDGRIDEDGQMDVVPITLTGAEQSSGQHLIQVPDAYQEAADQALSTERIPPGYREAVKTYFDEME